MTIRETASELRVHETTVQSYINAGTLPAMRLGRGYRIERTDLDRFIEQCKRRAPTPSRGPSALHRRPPHQDAANGAA